MKLSIFLRHYFGICARYNEGICGTQYKNNPHLYGGIRLMYARKVNLRIFNVIVDHHIDITNYIFDNGSIILYLTKSE